MTTYNILKYAYNGALAAWAKEKEILDRNPDNIIAQYKEKKKWTDLQEIREMLLKEEQQAANN